MEFRVKLCWTGLLAYVEFFFLLFACCASNKDSERATVDGLVAFAILFPIAVGMSYAGLSLFGTLIEAGTQPPLTKKERQRDRLWCGIQAGYRIMEERNLDRLPSGYRNMEAEYFRRYGTSRRYGPPETTT
jgi:hypothetical protein